MSKTCGTCGKEVTGRKNFCNRQCYLKTYNLENADKLKQQKAKYHKDNKRKIIARVNSWREANPGKANLYNRTYKKRKKSGRKSSMSLNDRLKHLVRTRVHDALNGRNKPLSVIKNIGCSIEELRTHIESKFYNHPVTQLPMSWNTLGKGKTKNSMVWQIDHVVPLHAFDLTDPEQFKRAIHYSNLQPLWYVDHAAKTANELKELVEVLK